MAADKPLERRRVRPANPPTGSPSQGLVASTPLALIMPDYERLQDAQYDSLPVSASEYARSQDETLPLWAICHTYRGAAGATGVGPESWSVNWGNVGNLYIYSGLTHSEISRFSGIAMRSIETRSSRLGWRQARRTYRLMKETDDTPDLKSLGETVRREKIEEFLTQSGYEVGRHAMQALLQNVDKIEPRDVPGLMQAAMKLLSMGEKIPSDYKFSKVDNPNSNAQPPNVNILNITPERAEELMETLARRKAVLDGTK